MRHNRFPIFALLALLYAAPPAAAQDAGGPATPLDRLGAVVRDGHLDVEADLSAGSVPAIPHYALEVQGSPRTRISADATDGLITKLHFGIEGGKLIVRGEGLRPKVEIESIDFESPRGVTDLKFRGLGIWKPIVAVFGGIARSAVRKMELRTDIPSMLRGEILGAKKTPAVSEGAPPPGPQPPSFMDLVSEVRIHDARMTAFAGKPVAFEPFLAFETAAHPRSGEAMHLSIEKGTFRPGHGGAASVFDMVGHIDGEIENGQMEFEKNKCAIVKGRLRGGAFEAKTGADGRVATAFSAEQVFFELSSGTFVVPGGLRVDLDSGSTFDVSRVRVSPSGKFSGVARLDLAGKTGHLSRRGATVSATDIRLKAAGLTVVDGRATGPLEVSFDYALAYPFVVKYPIEEIPEKRLMLDFHGPFATTLTLSDAGGDEGEVTGDYVFKAPWAPIEKAALVALEAKWQQDVATNRVDFTIVPKVFRPCGASCFTLGIEITAEKKSGKKSLFSQFCAPVGKAELFVDKPARAFVLKNVRIETRCKGTVGWVVNLISPLLAKTYGDLKLFQMPEGLPLTIETVRGGGDWIEIGGRIEWSAEKAASAD